METKPSSTQMNSVVQSVILAAGLGLRMKPMIQGPKSLISIGGKAVIDMIWERTETFLHPTILVIISQDERLFVEDIKRLGYQARIITDDSLMGPAASALKASGILSPSVSHLLLLLGDSISTTNQTIDVVRHLYAQEEVGIVGAAMSAPGNHGSRVLIEERGVLVAVEDKSSIAKWRWNGTICIPRPWISHLIPVGSLIAQIGEMAKRGLTFKVVKESGTFFNLNTPKDLAIARKLLLMKK